MLIDEIGIKMEIKNFEETYNSGQVVATFDLILHTFGFTFRKWKVVKNKSGVFFAKSPSFSLVEEDGDKKWCDYIEIESKNTPGFQNSVMNLLKPYLKNLSHDSIRQLR